MPTYQNKVAIIIRADLLEWQKLNVAAFLASSVAVKFPETHGRPFVTASRTEYLPFPKNPMLIYRAENDQQIRRAFMRAKERGLSIGIYTKPLFATKGEEENLAEILKVPAATSVSPWARFFSRTSRTFCSSPGAGHGRCAP